MVQSTRGPRAREDILLVERCQGNERGGITYFPVGDTFVSSETLLKKAPPFTSNWAVGFAIVCVLCLIFGWVRVQAATMIEERRQTEGVLPFVWPVFIMFPERNLFAF